MSAEISIESDLSIQIGRRIRGFRVQMGLTQHQLAERASMHQNHLGQVERGETNVTVHTVSRIADALGVRMTLILHD